MPGQTLSGCIASRGFTPSHSVADTGAAAAHRAASGGGMAGTIGVPRPACSPAGRQWGGDVQSCRSNGSGANAVGWIDVTTEAVPARERFAFWREAYCAPMGLVTEQEDRAAPFGAHISRLTGAPFVHVRCRQVERCHVGRGKRQIARVVPDSYALYRETGAGVALQVGGDDLVLRAGDIMVADCSLPFEARALGARFSHEAWLLPKAALAPVLPAGRPRVVTLAGHAPATRLLAAYLAAVGEEASNMTFNTLLPVMDTLARLVGIACGGDGDACADAVVPARLAQAKQYIEARLADPHLAPASIAVALGCSVRSLHVAFEPTGNSVTRYIQRRRLAECRAALLANPGRPVTDIAFAWGFSSLSGFYRAFQAGFGVAPGDLRAASRRDPAG